MIQMTEQAQTSVSAPEQEHVGKSARKDTRGLQLNPESENGAEDGRTNGKGDQESVDTELELTKPPLLMRLKAVDQPPLMPVAIDSETKSERKKVLSSQISKANAQYHKLFKEIIESEFLKQSYTCALQKDILYQGKLFVSDNWICFHSKVFGKDTKISIPVISVTLIKKTKTAILVPNALIIATRNDRHLFVSFLSRDTTYKILKSICFHLEDETTRSSPITSSTENSFRSDCPSSLPLDFSADFSDLDGVVGQRRMDIETSSSGSQTPDYENVPDSVLNAGKTAELAVCADVHFQVANQKHGAHHNGTAKPVLGAESQGKSLQPGSLNTLLLIYLFLVCVLVLSSCYMAFKIVALEHRLTSLGSMAVYPQNENAVHRRAQLDLDAEIYGELSTNLFKLEQIQRNLRKLLEET